MSCGGRSVFLYVVVVSPHGGVARVVSLVGFTSLMSPGSFCVSSLCAVECLVPVFCSSLSALKAGTRLFSALCHLVRAGHTTGVQQMMDTGLNNGSSLPHDAGNNSIL